MRKKSATSKIVRRKAVDIPPATEADLARLSQAMEGPIDTSDIPEQRVAFRRLTRDSTGRLPTRKSVIRDAIVRELEHLNMTPYRLWKEAKVYCPTLSQSAVHEFIKGQRQLELPYAEGSWRRCISASLATNLARSNPVRYQVPRDQRCRRSVV